MRLHVRRSIDIYVKLDPVPSDDLDVMLDGDVAIDLTVPEWLITFLEVRGMRIEPLPAVRADGWGIYGSIGDISWGRHDEV